MQTRSRTRPSRVANHNINDCRLLALPRELRDRIWKAATIPDAPIIMQTCIKYSKNRQYGEFSRVLMRRDPVILNLAKDIASVRGTCRSMRDEATAPFFKGTGFALHVHDRSHAEEKAQTHLAPPLHSQFASLICDIEINCPFILDLPFQGPNGITEKFLSARPQLKVTRSPKADLSVTWTRSLISITDNIIQEMGIPVSLVRHLLHNCAAYDEKVVTRLQRFGGDVIGRGAWLDHVVHTVAPGVWSKAFHPESEFMAAGRHFQMFQMIAMRMPSALINGRQWEQVGIDGQKHQMEELSWNVEQWEGLRLYNEKLLSFKELDIARARPLRLGVGGRLPARRRKNSKTVDDKWVEGVNKASQISFCRAMRHR